MDHGFSREENIVRRNEVSRRACAMTLDESPDICYARNDGTRETCPDQSDATMRRMSLTAAIVLGGILGACALVTPITGFAAPSMDQLTDLTGKASVVVTLKGRDNFTSEYRYDVSVRNHSSDLLIADSLVIVLDKITNLAGEDHEGLTGESFLTRFDILGQDGETTMVNHSFLFRSGRLPTLARSPTASLSPCASETRTMSQSLRLHLKCWGKNVPRLSRNKPKQQPQFSPEPLQQRQVATPSTS